MKMKFMHMAIVVTIAFTAFSCKETTKKQSETKVKEDTVIMEKDSSQNVFEIAIRKIKDTVPTEDFEVARDKVMEMLSAKEGAFNDREIKPFFDYTFSGIDLEKIFIGMTQYDDMGTYQGIWEDLKKTPEAMDFLGKMDLVNFQLLQPIEGYGPVDLSKLAPRGSGNVWEIAIRDISKYEGFDQTDYERKRDAFLAALSKQPGFIKEYQWKSVIDPNVVVGMTMYESQETVQALSQNKEFNESEVSKAFLGNYPPNVFGTMNFPLK